MQKVDFVKTELRTYFTSVVASLPRQEFSLVYKPCSLPEYEKEHSERSNKS